MDGKQLLVSITGSVDPELLLWNADLVTAHRILRQQTQTRGSEESRYVHNFYA